MSEISFKNRFAQNNPISSKKCDATITSDEMLRSLKSMANNKTPGNDALTKEFYILTFDILGPILLKCFNACHELGQLTVSQRQAVIKFIQKPGKDVRLLKSWRPISLLNVDLKILSTIMANRIKPILSNIVNYKQAAFVPENQYVQ